MWLHLIRFIAVSESIAEETELFNGVCHDPSLPRRRSQPKFPQQSLTHGDKFLGPWKDLVVRLRHIDPNDVYTVILTPRRDSCRRSFPLLRALQRSVAESLKNAGISSAQPEQLATSQRSRHAITDAFSDDSPIRIYFMPWDDAMDTQREYRVVCAPTTYLVENGMNARLNRDGFMFEVFVHTTTREVQLLELNPFGIRSSCGSCLFHRVIDAETLYGAKDEVEVRLAI
ncbi:hypothetical protein K438DRAFT_1750868 [Mycena galopus ATCC 62051]|nr:hypothetical protein K438DRAFT_1750868 [Mycena galopus ATCC 62051]